MPLQKFGEYSAKGSTPEIEETEPVEQLEPVVTPEETPEGTDGIIGDIEPEVTDMPVGAIGGTPSQNVKITINVEVLEGKIVKFENCQMKDIYEALNSKYADSNYFLRKKGNDIHIVKFNEELKLDVNRFIDSLFKFYGTTKNLAKIVEGVKVKGNAKFSVIEKLNPNFSDKVITDIVMLLSKKG